MEGEKSHMHLLAGRRKEKGKKETLTDPTEEEKKIRQDEEVFTSYPIESELEKKGKRCFITMKEGQGQRAWDSRWEGKKKPPSALLRVRRATEKNAKENNSFPGKGKEKSRRARRELEKRRVSTFVRERT